MLTAFVFSDSHGSSKNILSVLNKGLPDVMFYLGDGILDLLKVEEAYPNLKIVKVRGNCDKNSAEPLIAKFTLGGKVFLATHGNEFKVGKKDIRELIDFAFKQKPEVSVVMFGHTHSHYIDETLGMHIMNPGTCKKDAVNPTYGVISISDDGTISMTIEHIS